MAFQASRMPLVLLTLAIVVSLTNDSLPILSSTAPIAVAAWSALVGSAFRRVVTSLIQLALPSENL